jgi:hypothetical protein
MKRENNSLLEDSANQKKENSASKERESIARGFTVANQKIEKPSRLEERIRNRNRTRPTRKKRIAKK